jgi:hypothetical protein
MSIFRAIKCDGILCNKVVSSTDDDKQPHVPQEWIEVVFHGEWNNTFHFCSIGHMVGRFRGDAERESLAHEAGKGERGC